MMHTRAPRTLPTWGQLTADLCSPGASELAAHLGVSVRTVYGWKAADRAPRAVLLALFWESSYGLSTLDCELFNRFLVWKNLSESLGHENEKLRRAVAQLEATGDFGAANAPRWSGLAGSVRSPLVSSAGR